MRHPNELLRRKTTHSVPFWSAVGLFGIGAAIDMEDGPKGFGMHSDQERLLETELYRFVRFNYEVVVDLARAK